MSEHRALKGSAAFQPLIDLPVDSRAGLSTAVAQERLEAAGYNDIEKPRTRSLTEILLGTLKEPMFLLLVVAAGIYIVVGDVGQGAFLAFGAAVSIGLVVGQEARSEGALRALRSLAQPTAHVMRDGVERVIDGRSIVPGDILLVAEGQRIPADARLLDGGSLIVDESLLTGESAPVTKLPANLASDPAAKADSELLAGAMVLQGHGAAVVTATGQHTTFGQIGASLATLREDQTPLQKATRQLIGWIAVGALGFCGLVFLAYGNLRGDWLEAGLSALTAAIALLPEEFPMVLAVFVALGAWRLARHNVLVRRSAVIEALGAATLLCVDKTGTLTANRMTLARAWRQGSTFDLGEKGERPDRLLRVAALASPEGSIDAMDRAVHAAASLPTTPRQRLHRTWPLQPNRLAVIQMWRDGEVEFVAAKGAPEAVMRLCRLQAEDAREIRAQIDRLADDGLRVLAVASAEQSGLPEEPDQMAFTFEGLIAFLDPLRSDVADALAEARRAGIDVAMITGDLPATALAIARQAGISTDGGILTGADIDQLDDAALSERVRGPRVFARIRPEQKLRLVEAFKANGHVVAMTGDGVNDGPALQAADIGIAMGLRGSDVAREAADIVLLDDSFTSIVGGVRLGRRIFANLRKALTFITAVHVPLAGLALAPVMLGWPPFFLPVHVVMLELIVDPVCSLVFEAEPSERDAMLKPPRRSGEPLFGPDHVGFALLQGSVILLSVLVFYGWMLGQATPETARAAAFVALVWANLFAALSGAMSGSAGLFHRSRASFWFIVALASAVLLMSLYIPLVGSILQMAPLSLEMLGGALLIGMAAGGWIGLGKAATWAGKARRA